MGSLSRTTPTVAQFLGGFSCVRFFFFYPLLVNGWSAVPNISSPRVPIPSDYSCFPSPPPLPFPFWEERGPPLRKCCLQVKFTAAPGLSLRQCRTGVGMAEAADRALFICKGGRLSDWLRCLPPVSSLLALGLAGGFGLTSLW